MTPRITKMLRVLRSRSERQGQYRRRLWPYIHKLYGNVTMLGIDNGDEIVLGPASDLITGELLSKGHFQKDDVHSAVRIIQQLGLPTNGVFVDVGANIGTSSIYALKSGHFSSALCIEPSPENIRFLRANLILNGLDRDVIIQNAAATFDEGEIDLYLNKNNCGDHRAWQSDQERQSIKIRGAPLDTLIREAGIDFSTISMVWVDTQGYEPFVFAGAPDLLTSSVPILCEFWPWGLARSSSVERMTDALKTYFTTFYDLAEDRARVQRIEAIDDLAHSLLKTDHGGSHTDVLLIT